MLGIVDVSVQAKFPNMPLEPMFAYVGSASSIRVRNVPKKIGQWKIDRVNFEVAYPDQSVKSAECVLVGGVWVGTVEGSQIDGKCEKGYAIYATGVNEHGERVNDPYVLGKGDVEIIKSDGSITPGDLASRMYYYESLPQNPKEGDSVFIDGTLNVYDGEDWTPVSTGTSEISYIADENGNRIDADRTFTNTSGQTTTTGTLALVSQIPTKTSDLTNDSDFTTNTALNTGLAQKQNKLSDAEISAIDSVVDKRKTVVTYTDGTTAEFDIEGELTSSSITNLNDATTVRIGTAVTSIGNDAFSDCSGLTSVIIPNSVTSIGGTAFFYCNGLTNVTIPDGVTSIRERAFSDCGGLVSVTIPDSVTSIGYFAFENCSGLTNVTFVGKSLAEVQILTHYPWGLSNTSIITTWNDASQEWVKTQIPTKTSDLTNDSNFITSEQVEPSTRLNGYAENSDYATKLKTLDVSTSTPTDRGIIIPSLNYNSATNTYTLDLYGSVGGYYPWILRRLFGTDFSPVITLEWRKGTIWRKRVTGSTVRWSVTYNNNWMWVAKGQYAITCPTGDGKPDGKFYVLNYEDETHPNYINDPATDVHTITYNNNDITSIDGQTGGQQSQTIWCTRTNANPTTIWERAFAYRNELPTKTSDLTNDSGFIISSELSNYYTKTEIDNIIGNINTVLDNINGEVI